MKRRRDGRADQRKRGHFMRRFSLSFVAALLALATCLTLSGFAQRRGQYRDAAYTRENVNDLIHRVEDRSDAFVKLFDNALDRSSMDGSRKEDRLNDKAKELEKQLDKVRKEFDRAEGYQEVREHVAKALSVSEEINKVFRNRRLDMQTERQWGLLRYELNRLGRVYNLRPLK
jgi:hypothetical protein